MKHALPLESLSFYDKFIGLLEAANDETKTQQQHDLAVAALNGFRAAAKHFQDAPLNGDWHYIPKIENGEMEDRPMCLGEFLDWKHKGEM
jgi:hypothetical protein